MLPSSTLFFNTGASLGMSIDGYKFSFQPCFQKNCQKTWMGIRTYLWENWWMQLDIFAAIVPPQRYDDPVTTKEFHFPTHLFCRPVKLKLIVYGNKSAKKFLWTKQDWTCCSTSKTTRRMTKLKTDGLKNWQMDRQTDGQMNSQKDWQTEKNLEKAEMTSNIEI